MERQKTQHIHDCEPVTQGVPHISLLAAVAVQVKEDAEDPFRGCSVPQLNVRRLSRRMPCHAASSRTLPAVGMTASNGDYQPRTHRVLSTGPDTLPTRAEH